MILLVCEAKKILVSKYNFVIAHVESTVFIYADIFELQDTLNTKFSLALG